MFKLTWKHLGLMLVLSLTLVLAACGDEAADDEAAENGLDLGDDSLELVYVEWDSEIASTNVIAQVLEEAGYDVDATPIDNAIMWEAVASGDADGMVAAWLPGTHGDLYDEYSADLVELGENLEGAKIGAVVPEYMEDVNSIEDLADYTDEFNGTITGIEPGAGVVQAAEQAVEDYGLDDWTVETSSSGAMATALGQAYENEEPIVVTGWTPHWKFAEYDLKYLDDPEGSFGEAEVIETMVREGLEEDSPAAYQILDAFYWEAEDMEEVMLEVSEGATPEEAAANWIEANRDTVDGWLEAAE
ncbi:glycine betaine/proline transport system substrate-binding protein [Pelagirhabdus alkalitolerans]|uniref:Glycine betaine/proline transport system substrate-binding protein n=1 Tax=Pelagirhabdus alkalitolerans TaxID=1612202 RepID=A0A1G6NBS3_9BACI|nr:glycine betaine ABC transporter substrate-binding protein [Pelagirhabdus alkalitolerans]SDC65309.1 glycine betaine/proline transport system substrate-binding protein [Pelagirhabdus alkalitolerans]